MTRINVIPVEELTNKHLLAEYRELPRISRAARHPKQGEQFPNSYVLGAGHVKFFYDKGTWLAKRFNQLVNEMHIRGYNTNYMEYRPHPEGLNNDWSVDAQALELNRERIRERLNKPKEVIT